MATSEASDPLVDGSRKPGPSNFKTSLLQPPIVMDPHPPECINHCGCGVGSEGRQNQSFEDTSHSITRQIYGSGCAIGTQEDLRILGTAVSAAMMKSCMGRRRSCHTLEAFDRASESAACQSSKRKQWSKLNRKLVAAQRLIPPVTTPGRAAGRRRAWSRAGRSRHRWSACCC